MGVEIIFNMALFSVHGLHMLHIDISEEGTVLYPIDRVVMVNGDYTDRFTGVQVQYG